MRRRKALAWLASPLAAAAAWATSIGAAGAEPLPMRGVCYATWQTDEILATQWSDRKLADLPGMGVNWVALRVSRVQQDFRAWRIQPGYCTPSDEAVAHVIRECHHLGMKVMLSPVVEFKDPSKTHWRGLINPEAGPGDSPLPSAAPPAGVPDGTPGAAAKSDAPAPGSPWARWMACYERMALHYARLSQDAGVDLYCFGAEMISSTSRFQDPWIDLIHKIWQVYSGPLTYQANWCPLRIPDWSARGADMMRKNKWDAEYKTIRFWNLLDYASLCAYFSLTDKPDAPLEELEKNLAAWREDLAAWQKSVGKPVLVTEIGYPSAAGGAREPWGPWIKTQPNPALQARCYEAFFRAFYREPWVKGIFWWVVCAPGEHGMDEGGTGYPFMGKPAEEVVRRWYLGEETRK